MFGKELEITVGFRQKKLLIFHYALFGSELGNYLEQSKLN